ncbi:MAG TPA: hypothetical protein VFZ66_25090 [Herpetosiphonaceae bacterium]
MGQLLQLPDAARGAWSFIAMRDLLELVDTDMTHGAWIDVWFFVALAKNTHEEHVMRLVQVTLRNRSQCPVRWLTDGHQLPRRG